MLKVGGHEHVFRLFLLAIKLQSRRKKSESVGLVETQLFFLFTPQVYCGVITFGQIQGGQSRDLNKLLCTSIRTEPLSK